MAGRGDRAPLATQKRRAGWPDRRYSIRIFRKENDKGGLEALAIHPLAEQLAGAANGLGLFAGAALRRLLVATAKLHLAENAFALHLLLERAESLIDIVVADQNVDDGALLL